MGFDSPGQLSSLHTSVEEDTSSISLPGLPGWLWNLWPVNWRAVTRQTMCRARHQGGWLSAPHRGQGRVSHGPGWYATQNMSAGPSKLHGTRHGLRATPVRSGPVQSTEYRLAEPQGTSSKAGRNRHHTHGLGNLGRHERRGPPSSSMRRDDHPPALDTQWKALRAQVSTSSLDGHATWWTTHANRKEATIRTRNKATKLAGPGPAL